MDIKENIKKFEEVLIDYKKNPEKYKSGKHYQTENGALIRTIHGDEYSVFGIIIESKCKAEIGLHNVFFHSELKEVFMNTFTIRKLGKPLPMMVNNKLVKLQGYSFVDEYNKCMQIVYGEKPRDFLIDVYKKYRKYIKNQKEFITMKYLYNEK